MYCSFLSYLKNVWRSNERKCSLEFVLPDLVSNCQRKHLNFRGCLADMYVRFRTSLFWANSKLYAVTRCYRFVVKDMFKGNTICCVQCIIRLSFSNSCIEKVCRASLVFKYLSFFNSFHRIEPSFESRCLLYPLFFHFN